MTITTQGTRDDRAAIDKAISLLAAFEPQGISGVGVSELARRTKLSKSTAYRVLGTLERNGVVERLGTQYRLGGRLHEIGKTAYSPDQEQTRDLLIPFLTDLYVATRETVHLATLHGTEVVYLAKLYGHKTIPSPSRIGGRISAHCTAVGKALLAYDFESEEKLMSSTLHKYTTLTITDPGQIARELESVRRDGVAFENGEVQPGLSCVAVPILDSRRQPIAAFSVSGPTGRIDSRRCELLLRRISTDAAQTMLVARKLYPGHPQPAPFHGHPMGAYM